jgi:hypothetical protein
VFAAVVLLLPSKAAAQVSGAFRGVAADSGFGRGVFNFTATNGNYR